MLKTTNKSVLAAAALLAGMISGMPAAEARFDLGLPSSEPSNELRSDVASLKLRPSYDAFATASLMPRMEVTAPVRSVAPNYNVFKSVVVPIGKLPAFAQWGKVKPAAFAASDFCANGFCRSAAGRKLAAVAERARRLPQVEALKLINREVNRTIAYRSDKGDTWQTLAQSAARGAGDCEDFAIAKMQLLAKLGFAPDQLQFIVLKDTRRQLYHAVLAVHVEGKRFILDNLSNTAASDDIFRTYKPIVSFVGSKSYVHGFKGGQSAVAMGKGGMSAIRLGEGN